MNPALPRISRSAWPALVADPRNRLGIDRRWLGYQVRRDAWSTPAHTNDRHRLWLAAEGVAQIAISGRPMLLGPGAALWLPRGVTFACAWPPLWRFHEILFDLVAGRGQPTVTEGALVIDHAWELAPLFDRFADRARDPSPLREPVLRHLLAAILAECIALDGAPLGRGGLDPGQRDRIGRLVREHIADCPVPGDLARLLGLQPDYFARRFRITYGCSPRSWLAAERIRAAARLIHDGAMGPAAAARALGFGDLAQFSRRFRTVMGRSPRAWRRSGG